MRRGEEDTLELRRWIDGRVPVSDLWLWSGDSSAPALRQDQAVDPMRLQTQTSLFQNTGHGFLLRDPEEPPLTERGEGRGRWMRGDYSTCRGTEPHHGVIRPITEIYSYSLKEQSYLDRSCRVETAREEELLEEPRSSRRVSLMVGGKRKGGRRLLSWWTVLLRLSSSLQHLFFLNRL